MNIGIIPARLNSKRFPKKILMPLNGKPMVANTVERSLKAKNLDRVILAIDSEEAKNALNGFDFEIVMTSKEHTSGTDRIAEVAQGIEEANIIINIQGDEPMIDIQDIKNLSSIAQKNQSEIATLACKLNDKKKINNENVVKVETFDELEKKRISKAIKFTRNIQVLDSQKIYQHIGIYHYKVSILKKFIELPQTNNEIKFKLEQLRALENNINIDVILANSAPIGVDTENDYIEIKKLMEYKS